MLKAKTSYFCNTAVISKKYDPLLTQTPKGQYASFLNFELIGSCTHYAEVFALPETHI